MNKKTEVNLKIVIKEEFIENIDLEKYLKAAMIQAIKDLSGNKVNYKIKTNSKVTVVPNVEEQEYKGVKLKLITRDYTDMKAKRYTINGTNQNLWIPNCYLLEDGTIKDNVNLDFIFNKAETKHKINISLGLAKSNRG